ncbi:TonB-dependent receptor domain-containing protein [Novosphingobium sp. ZW T3_23]|uniref:TonB-dependent receptor domain-containing protein n=1 Tax=Novosphingobium sp. ZW T3_23 TaxID=3378084 RepID=UPI0038552948
MSSSVSAHRRLLAVSRHLLLAGSALCIAAPAMAQAPARPANTAAREINIPAQPLSEALRQLMRQGGLQIGFEAADIGGKTSAGVSGRMSAGDALSRMLAGTGLTFRYLTTGSVVLERGPELSGSTVQLGTLRVGGVRSAAAGNARGGDNGRVAGWDGTRDGIYRTPGSMNVITRETLEAYPATSPADMLRGTPGVISGEARTSGGLDVNIRGLQGQGRVPVTVDGAINGTTVYRGYQGVSNRSFVDPDFISHVAIEKGPSMGSAIAGGIGGSVSMTTIGVDDIVPEGDTMGIRIKGSLSNNSKAPGSSMTRTLLEPSTYYGDSLAATRMRDRPDFLTPTGGSGSLVFARKGDAIDMVAGYSFRRTGNYYAGANGKYAPEATGTPSALCLAGTPETRLSALCDRAVQFYDKHGSTGFVGGEEVYNTSTDAESVLAKVMVRPAEDHVIELGYGGYWNTYGENYPGALGSATGSVFQNSVLSRSSLDRFTARYRWNPDSDLVDLKLNGWTSHLKESAPSLANSDPSRRKMESWGADLSNASRALTPVGLFSADYGASFLHEKAGPIGKWVSSGGIPPGREGTRKEFSLFLQSALEPVSWLRLDAGARYQKYDLKDRQSGTTYHTDIFDRSEDAFGYSLGAAVMPMEGLQIFASYKQAARLPSLMEATTGFFMIANPDLHKETAHNWEYGANYSGTGVLSDKDELGVKLAWFDNDIKGYIARRYISQYFAMQMYNIDQAQFRGLEGSLSYRTGGFSLDAGATWYDRIRFCRPGDACLASSLASDYSTNYIPPEWSANLSVSQKFLDDRAMLGARFTYIGKRPISAEKPQSGYMPLISAIAWNPYTLLDLTGQYKLTDGLSVDFSVDNVTDRYYVEAMSLGYVPAPGRTFRIGFTGTFGAKDGAWPGNWFSGSGNAETIDWTGPYVGFDIGYGVGRSKGTVTDSAGNPADLANDSRISLKMRNAIGGLHAGYDYQFANNLVLGVEADIGAGNLGDVSTVAITEESGNTAYLQQNGKLESDTRYDWNRMITLRGKLGYSLGRTLVYGTGGAAWLRETATRNQYFSSDGGEGGIGSLVEHAFEERVSKNRKGFTLGGGIERALGAHWSLRAEYNYAHFGKKKAEFSKARAGISQDWTETVIVGYEDIPFGDEVWTFPVYGFEDREGTSDIVNGRVNRTGGDLHTMRIGISYRF